MRVRCRIWRGLGTCVAVLVAAESGTPTPATTRLMRLTPTVSGARPARMYRARCELTTGVWRQGDHEMIHGELCCFSSDCSHDGAAALCGHGRVWSGVVHDRVCVGVRGCACLAGTLKPPTRPTNLPRSDIAPCRRCYRPSGGRGLTRSTAPTESKSSHTRRPEQGEELWGQQRRTHTLCRGPYANNRI